MALVALRQLCEIASALVSIIWAEGGGGRRGLVGGSAAIIISAVKY